MTLTPTTQVQRAMPFACPLCLTTFPTRKLLLEHLRSDPELEHKTFRFGATESSLYPQLTQQGVFAPEDAEHSSTAATIAPPNH